MFLRYNGILGFGVLVCLFVIWNFAMVENEICVIESVSTIDQVLFDVNTIPFRSHNFLYVENVHQQQCDRDLPTTFNEVYIQAMEQQVLLQKPHNRTSICYSIFCCE